MRSDKLTESTMRALTEFEDSSTLGDKEKFFAYEDVRRSGVTNMYDIPYVEMLSGLDKDDIIYVMKNYTELNNKYKDEYDKKLTDHESLAVEYAVDNYKKEPRDIEEIVREAIEFYSKDDADEEYNRELDYDKVLSMVKSILHLNENKKLNEDEDIPDITGLLERYNWEVDIVTEEQLGDNLNYKTLCTNVSDAEKFNYESDYWGDADDYQFDNVTLMEQVEPYVGKEVEVYFEDDGFVKFKILGIAIDDRYNSLKHTVILAELLGKLDESKKNVVKENVQDEIKYDKEIEVVKKSAPKEFKYLSDNAFLYTPNNVYIELRPETTFDDKDEVYMDFTIFETEEDMNTDYEKNIGNEYHDILKPEEYWKFVADYINSVVSNRTKNESKKVEGEQEGQFNFSFTDHNLYGSIANSDALDTLDDLSSYFEGYASYLDSHRVEEQALSSEIDLFVEVGNELNNIKEKLVDYWEKNYR